MMNPLRILIIKISSLGDIIHAFPLLPYLKQQTPHVEVDWVVEGAFAELVRAHPLVHHVLPVEIKQWRSFPFQRKTWQEIKQFHHLLRSKKYDKVFDLQGNTKSGYVTFLARGGEKIGLDYASVSEWPNLLATRVRYRPPAHQNVREESLFLAQSSFKNFTPQGECAVRLSLTPEERPLFEAFSHQLSSISFLKGMVCAGSQWPNKQLSKETLQTFLHFLVKRLNMHFVFIWGNQKEKAWGEELSAYFRGKSTLLPKLSLPVLQNLMGEMDVVISMDSLPLHLAGTTLTATYSLFGPSSAHKYKPPGKRHHAFQGKCPYQEQFERRCARLRSCPTGACLKDLKGEELAQDFLQWWTKRP